MRPEISALTQGADDLRCENSGTRAEKAIAGLIPWEYVWTNFQSWRANARRGNTRSVVQRMTELYINLIGVYENGRHRHQSCA